jgi:hypothetical protein
MPIKKRPGPFGLGRLGSPPPELPNHDSDIRSSPCLCKCHLGNRDFCRSNQRRLSVVMLAPLPVNRAIFVCLEKQRKPPVWSGNNKSLITGIRELSDSSFWDVGKWVNVAACRTPVTSGTVNSSSRFGPRRRCSRTGHQWSSAFHAEYQ